MKLDKNKLTKVGSFIMLLALSFVMAFLVMKSFNN